MNDLMLSNEELDSIEDEFIDAMIESLSDRKLLIQFIQDVTDQWDTSTKLACISDDPEVVIEILGFNPWDKTD